VRALGHALDERQGPSVATATGALRVQRTAAVLDGEVLALSPSSLAVLRLLVEAGGAVVPRQQLLAALPGGSSDPHAAEVAVGRLRDALGPRRDLVRTVVKRGYSLAGVDTP
jgi:uroporphyrinogen-III synthase